MNKVFIESIGCKVNQYEKEALKSLLINEGFEEAETIQEARVYLLNTCAVTKEACSKSKKKIRSIKKNHPNVYLVVLGCFSQEVTHLRNDISLLKEGADLVVSNQCKKDIPFLIKNKTKGYITLNNGNSREFNTLTLCKKTSKSWFSSKSRAYVLIQDGCSNFCTYCKIPYLRGVSKSRSLEDVLNEAKELISLNFKEIVIIGINIADYKYNNVNLIKLLEKIINLPGSYRIRLSSIEPWYINDEFIEFFTQSQEKICNHLHIPLQSGDDYILSLMNRKYTTSFYASIINKLRKKVKDLSITTDIIVGFPQESEANFKNTYNFAKEMQFLKMHIFRYSTNPYDKYCNKYKKEEPPEEVKKARAKALLELNNLLFFEYRKRFENKILEAIIQQSNQGLTREYIKVSLLNNDISKKPGRLEKVLIKRVDLNNTYAEIINSS
jgi:threonylcarbamoyladenosine tRNA methylthiotransferase MtaB